MLFFKQCSTLAAFVTESVSCLKLPQANGRFINPKLQEVTAPFSDGTFVDDCGGGSDGEHGRCVKGTQLQGTQLQGQEITWQPGIIRATCALPGFGRNWH